MQSSGKFDVDTQHVVKLKSSLLDAKLSKLSVDCGPAAEITDSELNIIASKYESFLRECNAVDMSDVFSAVTSACSDFAELAEIVGQTSFLIVNPQFHCRIEVSLMNSVLITSLTKGDGILCFCWRRYVGRYIGMFVNNFLAPIQFLPFPH